MSLIVGSSTNHATQRIHGRFAVHRDRSVALSDHAVEIPEIAIARIAVGNAPLLFIGGIDADPEEAGEIIVENMRLHLEGRHRRLSMRIRRRPEIAEHDVTPGRGIEFKGRVGEGALYEPGGRIAGTKGRVAVHALELPNS